MGGCAVSGAWERESEEAEIIHSPQYRYVRKRKKRANPGTGEEAIRDKGGVFHDILPNLS